MSQPKINSSKLMFERDIYTKIARDYGTPCYIYDANQFTRNFQEFKQAFAELNAKICFAVKANSNLALLHEIGLLGSGADIVSQGEMMRALKANLRPIIFSGVGKSQKELAFALANQVDQINIESVAEFELLQQLLKDSQQIIKVSIRVNPDIHVVTHDKIATGRKGDKFGLPFDEAHALYRRAQEIFNIDASGVALHIGSQLLTLAPYRVAFQRVKGFIQQLASENIHIEAVDVGGGLGIAYQGEDIPQIVDYASMVADFFADYTIYLEPGRRIAGNAGELLTQLVGVKVSGGKKFAILDAAMNDLLRPALYQAWHEMIPIDAKAHEQNVPENDQEIYDIVGPICETGDSFAKDRVMSPLTAGDLLVIKDCGAYGAVMASSYNARDLIPEIMVRDHQIYLVRKRVTPADFMALEMIPQ